MPWEKPTDINQTQIIVDYFSCPICGSEDCVPPAYAESNVLWIGDKPESDEEINRGKPFLGLSGKLLQNELRYMGLALYSWRMCNLWLHPPSKNKKSETYKDCWEHSVNIVLQEAKDKKLVVLVGAEPVKFFTGQSVNAWNGLLVISSLLTNPYILAMIKPSSAFSGGVGEVKFALNRFKHYLEEINDQE